MYRFAIIPHEMKLRITLIPNKACGGIRDSLRQRQLATFQFRHAEITKQEDSCALVFGGFSSLLLDRARFHESELPNMSIEILKTVTIHKAVVLRFVVRCSAGRNSFANRLVDFFPTIGRQAHQNFGALS